MAEVDFLADLADGQADLLDEIGGSVTYSQPGLEPFALTCIWSESTGNPTTCWTALSGFPLLDSGEYAEPRKNDEITRNGRIYRVVGDPPAVLDGTGGVTLQLRLITRIP
ncbi:MAG: hypothetical protein ABFD60_11330 [Bryobacteraceae bacterium]